MAVTLSRAHTSAETADHAKVLLLNKWRENTPTVAGYRSIPPNSNRNLGADSETHEQLCSKVKLPYSSWSIRGLLIIYTAPCDILLKVRRI